MKPCLLSPPLWPMDCWRRFADSNTRLIHEARGLSWLWISDRDKRDRTSEGNADLASSLISLESKQQRE
jgi:hypothetical protein